MGEWTPTPEWFVSLLGGRVHRRRSVASLSVLPGLAARRRAGDARRAGGLDARVEVGRHPRAAGEARGRRPPVVARRGADHAPLPGDRRGRDPPARRHRARRRSARLPRRTAAALLRAAAAHRPPEAGRADGEGGPGRVHDLRHPGGGRRGHPRPPAARAARAADRAARLARPVGRRAPSLAIGRRPRAGRSSRSSAASRATAASKA